jgi:hypothetical protein
MGARAVLGTIRPAHKRLRPAKEKIGTDGIADRPSAGLAVESEEWSALRRRDIRVDGRVVGIGLGIDNPSRK